MTRRSLATVGRAPSGAVELRPTRPGRPGTGLPVPDAAAYSRFKHGDGVVAARYGHALGVRWLATRHHFGRTPAQGEAGRPLVVASSGFDVARPAAHALVAPFVAVLRSAGVTGWVAAVHRATPSDGDYATMTAAGRAAALGADDLLVPAGVRGARVLLLDDVRVTGVHERAMDRALRRAGAARVEHLYVAQVRGRRVPPSVEAELNAVAVRTTHDLLAVARTPGFVPNARVGRWVLGLDAAALDACLDAAPPTLVRWLVDVACADASARLERYREGARRLRALAADRHRFEARYPSASAAAGVAKQTSGLVRS